MSKLESWIVVIDGLRFFMPRSPDVEAFRMMRSISEKARLCGSRVCSPSRLFQLGPEPQEP